MTVARARIGLTWTYSVHNHECQHKCSATWPLTDYAPLEKEECMRVADINLPPEQVGREDGIFRRTAVEQNQQGSFPAEICDEQVKEAVDHKGLWAR